MYGAILGDIFEYTKQKISMYEDIELSEKQIEEGKVKDADEALTSLRK